MRPLLLSALFFVLFAGPAPARAESYLALGAGFSVPQNITDYKENGSIDFGISDIKVDNAIVWGARLGHFLDGKYSWFGAELDYYERRPDVPKQAARFTASAVSNNTFITAAGSGQVEGDIRHIRTAGIAAMFRLPDREFWEPYFKVGLAVNFLETGQFRSFNSSGAQTGVSQSGVSDISLGPMIGGGSSFKLTDALYAFAEAKYTRSKFTLSQFDRPLDATLTYSGIVAMFGLRFNFTVEWPRWGGR